LESLKDKEKRDGFDQGSNCELLKKQLGVWHPNICTDK